MRSVNEAAEAVVKHVHNGRYDQGANTDTGKD